MSNSSDLIKSIVKGNSDLSEDAALDKYLMSRGINPKFATKDQKVAHSKTNAFITWKNNRMIESLTTTQSPVMLKKNLLDKSKRMNKEIHHEETKKDDEYSDPHMAVNQLKTIMHNAEELIEMLGDDTDFLEENMVIIIVFYDGKPVGVELPNFVELDVIETDPGFKGDTVSGGSKPAKLSAGATVQVPLFIEVGDKIRVDTRKHEYVTRVTG